MLALEGKRWSERAADDRQSQSLNLSDGRFVSYQQLEKENSSPYAGVATEETFLEIEAASQRALDRIADQLAEAAPDVVIIVGDDQHELFSPRNMPAISIFYGHEILTHEHHATPNMPEWRSAVAKGYAMDRVRSFPGHAPFALELIQGLVAADVDVAVADGVEDPLKAGFGHAYGFVIERLFKGRSIPVIPILLNTYYPPNAPTARRCYDIGRKLQNVIAASEGNLRVALAASGGLSHFVVDAALDLKVLGAIKGKDAEVLRGLTRSQLNSGSSEILNWVLVAAASESLNNDWTEYYPLYRTPAGTGVGVGFATWR